MLPSSLAKTLIPLGLILVAAGVLLQFWGRISWLERLPSPYPMCPGKTSFIRGSRQDKGQFLEGEEEERWGGARGIEKPRYPC